MKPTVFALENLAVSGQVVNAAMLLATAESGNPHVPILAHWFYPARCQQSSDQGSFPSTKSLASGVTPRGRH